jgi:hypothetical protein
MISISYSLTASSLRPKLDALWAASAPKILSIDKDETPNRPTPVYTVAGKYTARGWTEWTQGFVYGSAILQFDATGDDQFLELGRRRTVEKMAHHLTHIGVHDHGFNNVSTYGNLLRLQVEGKIPDNPWERKFYELALKLSGAVQAARWTRIADGGGYIYSFNGPHSLFADTIRSLRVLAISHQLGHVLMGERDRKINLLERLIQHATTTSRYAVFFGKGRDAYDIRGRVAHESIFNTNDGTYRCPNSQQGYSPFTTWTRGHAWILCGYAEQLEWLQTRPEDEFESFGGKDAVLAAFLETALATADFYIEQTPTDGIPYWDTGAPGLRFLGDYLNQPAQIDNDHEPVDSSAAAISAQGLLRLGKYLKDQGRTTEGERYWQCGLTVADRLLDPEYLCSDPRHQGLLLHSIYHRPNNWDYIPSGSKIPKGEACMWGDYHLRELGLYLERVISGGPYYTFFPQTSA